MATISKFVKHLIRDFVGPSYTMAYIPVSILIDGNYDNECISAILYP